MDFGNLELQELLVTSFEVFSDSVLVVTTQEFHQGALGMVVLEWMRRNVARFRAEYQEKILNRSNTRKCLAPPQGGKDMDADGALMAMDEGEGGRATPPLLEFDLLEMTSFRAVSTGRSSRKTP